MKNKLSHSSCSKYQTCPRAYKYHYIDKLRSRFSSAALLFGSAVDRAVNQLLVPKGNKSSESIFDYNWRFGDIAGKKEYLPECIKIVYAKADFDKELLTREDLDSLLKRTSLQKDEDLFEYYKTMSETKETIGFANMAEDDRKIFNYFNWLCLRRKGYLMIDAYRTQIMPNIVKVHAIQKYIELENDQGDKIIGYVDLVADWLTIGNTVIFDLKTSAMQYEDDAVVTSPQLTLYIKALEEEYGSRSAGYIVLKKQVDKQRIKICSVCSFDGSGSRHKTCSNVINNKRCEGAWSETINPKINFQIIIDTVPKNTENIVMENFKDINENIHQKRFHRNLGSCHSPFKCDFIKICWKDDYSEVIKQETKKENR